MNAYAVVLEVFLEGGQELDDGVIVCWLEETVYYLEGVLEFPEELDESEHQHFQLWEIIEANVEDL